MHTILNGIGIPKSKGQCITQGTVPRTKDGSTDKLGNETPENLEVSARTLQLEEWISDPTG